LIKIAIRHCLGLKEMPLQPAAKYPQNGAWASGWGEIAGTAMEIFPINRSYFRHVSHVIVVCIRTSSPTAPSPRNGSL